MFQNEVLFFTQGHRCFMSIVIFIAHSPHNITVLTIQCVVTNNISFEIFHYLTILQKCVPYKIMITAKTIV